ncbi:L-rhamnose mutarotase [Hephaestia sp. GCM10023244]|uniref:L-rhamnose mutarotase n=1 Tax=unclassified Hephaestia TaxID=2631281 RepID=UPI002076FE6B|nr:L-rhamnose mutarotase [Hephaestia sp. MAHUQ-44]MCM8729977.1 L-rhamnose mutarotase [Hephaestia sp. MAHUQ-44]
MTQRYCLALDLVDDADLIAEYERWHRAGQTPPAIVRSIRAAGIENMELFRAGNRMVMVIDAADDFSFARKAAMDLADPAVVAWEEQMARFQQPVPAAGKGEKWTAMTRIFRLTDHPGDGAG